MEIEHHLPQELNFIESDLAQKQLEIPESKSAQRMRYEAEVDLIKKKFGTLDVMREKMGFSRRRMCEFLLVDPSAWTRWTTNTEGEDNAPAHVYKTMALLIERYGDKPEEFPQLRGVDKHELVRQASELRQEWKDESARNSKTIEMSVRDILLAYRDDIERRMMSHFEKVKTVNNESQELGLGWKILLIVNFVIILFLAIR